MSPLLFIPLESCDECKQPAALMARTRKGRLCRGCWGQLPEKMRWLPPATLEETHRAEVKAREAMQKRGGTDRHLVRNGMS